MGPADFGTKVVCNQICEGCIEIDSGKCKRKPFSGLLQCSKFVCDLTHMSVAFQDPSVQQAATRPTTDPSEDFNPFAQNVRPAAAQSTPAPNAQVYTVAFCAFPAEICIRMQRQPFLDGRWV